MMTTVTVKVAVKAPIILIVDGQNLAYAANMTRPLSTKSGFPTHAIKGFLEMLGGACQRFQANDVVVTWDNGRSPYRLALFPEYKANRDAKKADPAYMAKDAELKLQIAEIKVLVDLLGFKQIEGENLEGDDAIAITWMALKRTLAHAVIVSADHDFYQLVNEQTAVFNPINNGSKHKLVELANFAEATGGLTPEQYLEFKAMVGDTSDNIPGIRGVGPDTALSILLRFGTYKAFVEAVHDGGYTPVKFEKKAYIGVNEFYTSMALMDLKSPMTGRAISGRVKQGQRHIEGFEQHLQRLEFKHTGLIASELSKKSLTFTREISKS